MARNVKKPLKGTSLYDLLKILKGLKECEGETREGSYNLILYTLKVKNREKINISVKEAFLIKATNKLFGEYTTDADITLMTLGLLEGYQHAFIESGADRRIKYLKESPYLVNSEGRDDASYDKADDKLKKNYKDRLIKREDSLLLELADFMITQSYHIEEFLKDIDDYIDGEMAIFPTPGYIKRKSLHNRIITAVVKYLLLGKEIFTTRDDKLVNKNNECEITVNLTEHIIRMASASLCVILPFFMFYYIQDYKFLKTQQNYSYAITEGISKQDYTIPLAKQEGLSDADADDSISISGKLSLAQFRGR